MRSGPFLLVVLFAVICVDSANGAPAAAIDPLPGASREAEGIPYAHPSSIRYSPGEDLFYLADTGNRRIVFLHVDLEPAGSVSLIPFRLEPYCALPVGDGSAWVSDLNHPDIYRVDARGDRLDTLRLGSRSTPGRMIWGTDGRILLIERAGRLVLSIDPLSGIASAETLRVPTEGVLEDLTFVGQDLVVSAATGAPFWSLRAGTKEWASWGTHGDRAEDYSFPCGVAGTEGGVLYVVDAFRHELRRLDRAHKMIVRTGGMGTNPGQLLFPISLAVDRQGNPAVLERGGCRVQRFTGGE
jgi:sugar lactone lactonase YvrE